MARKADGNAGCGLIAICLLVILAIGKCGGGGGPSAGDANEAASASPSAVETTPMYVTAASLNCRAEPEAGATVIEKLVRGDAVSAGETRGSWVSLDRAGVACWVAQRFLSESEPEPEAEPVSPSRPARLLSPPPSDPLQAVSSRRSGPSCGAKWKCGQMDSCAEAYHYLNDCGVGRLDGDGDGVPCESIC
ncbi:excalibur calcium-binding domain-containing protein [uncultured Sphingobium sp.]|uniref:excalibur calcium-binding domain-containing protein n=1 Tax=uncultured Sphingobium sp. TaxID=316087 RepID=UPI00260D7D76|nr:excalibur calcium-binding domain-containing protein [uncultured Sphingobium sp.]